MSQLYSVLVFFGGTPQNGETTGQPYACQQNSESFVIVLNRIVNTELDENHGYQQ